MLKNKNPEDEEISLINHLLENSFSLDSFYLKWNDSLSLKKFLSIRNSKKILRKSSTKTSPAIFCLPITARPILPNNQNFDKEWTEETIGSVNNVLSTNALGPVKGWVFEVKKLLISLNLPLLTACTFKDQKNVFTTLGFVNNFILMGFLMKETMECLLKEKKENEIKKMIKEFKECLVESFKEVGEEVEKKEKVKSFVRYVYKKLDQIIADRKNKTEFYSQYKKDISTFLDVFIFKLNINNKKIGLIDYLKQRINEQLWFNVTIWHKINYFDTFYDLFIGPNKEAQKLIDLTALHISLTQDVIRYSRDLKENSKWNVILIIKEQFELDLENSEKIVILMLEDVRKMVDKEINRLSGLKGKFLTYKENGFESLKKYCLNCMSASIVWGSRSDYFNK